MTFFADHATMERALVEFCRRIREDFPNTVNAGLALRLVSCDHTTLRCTLALDGQDWMRNPSGVMHGGVVAAALDVAMGAITYVCSGNQPTPTISLQISYVRPVPVDALLYLDVQANGMGRTVGNLNATLYRADEPERVLATASGAYYTVKHK